MVDQDLLGEGERAAEPFATELGVGGEIRVHGLDEFDRGGGSRRHVDNYNTSCMGIGKGSARTTMGRYRPRAAGDSGRRGGRGAGRSTSDMLGLVEVPKPPALAARGGAWFEAGAHRDPRRRRGRLRAGPQGPSGPARRATSPASSSAPGSTRGGATRSRARAVPRRRSVRQPDRTDRRRELRYDRATRPLPGDRRRTARPRRDRRRPGSLLPSESELSAEFSASRVTVRRALELVRDDGLIAARQGFGWFVVDRAGAAEPRATRHDRVAARDERPRPPPGRCIEFAFESPPAHVRSVARRLDRCCG